MRNLANFMTNAEKCRSECKQLLVEKSTRAFLLVEKKKREQIDGLLTHELNIFDAKNAMQSINDLLTIVVFDLKTHQLVENKSRCK
jgi:hypothetical protein